MEIKRFAIEYLVTWSKEGETYNGEELTYISFGKYNFAV